MYLLDTNIITYLQRGNSNVINNVNNVNIDQICICSVIIAECFYGAYHHPTRSKELVKTYTKYFQTMDNYDFDTKAAIEYAKIKNILANQGNSIADMDLIIASICIVNNLILVTNNIKDFDRIQNLKLENWSK